MKEVGCDKMVEDCNSSHLPYPGRPEAQSGSHDWHKGWNDSEENMTKQMKW